MRDFDHSFATDLHPLGTYAHGPAAKMAVANPGCHFGSLRAKLNCAPEASELRKLGAFPQFFPIAHCASWAISRETVAQVGGFLGKTAYFCLREPTAILAEFAQVAKNTAKSSGFVAQVGKNCGDFDGFGLKGGRRTGRGQVREEASTATDRS